MNKSIHSAQRLIRISVGVIVASIFFINVLCAQTGPGGVGNADGSSGQPENLIWLDAGNIASSDGTDISTWLDASGNDFHLGVSSASSSGLPTFRLGSFNYLEFNEGENDRLVINPMSKFPATEITTFILYRTNDSGEGILSYDVSGGGNEYLLLNSDNIKPHIRSNGKNTGATFRGNVWSILNNSWRSSDGKFTLYKNGTEIHNSVHRQGNTLRNGGSLAIGGDQDGIDSGYEVGQNLQGDIAEVIIYDAFLNDAQRIIVENYLNAKYNISIANDYYTGDTPANGDYDYNVAGIGYDGSASHTAANSAGFIVSTYNTTLNANGEYLIVGHDNITNATSTANLQTGVAERYEKDWYVDETGAFDAALTFDLNTAYPGGKFPKHSSNYVLLKHNTGTSTYDSVSVGGANKVISGSQITFRVTDGNLTDGTYTLGTTDAAASPVEGVDSKTWYVYQDGNWNNPNTWTTDASTAPLFKNPDNEIPDPIDDVIIRSGRTVTIQSTTNNLIVNSIKVDGNLNLTTSSGHNFNTVNGRGEIRMAGNGGSLIDNFPLGDMTDNIGFADADNGGTVVIRAAADITLNTPRTFRHMRIELTNNTNKVIIGNNITLNGNLEVRNGILQFGDGTANGRTLTVNGNVLVTNNGSDRIGSISTSTANTRHKFEIKGDFTNNGISKFTNRANFASDTDRLNPNYTYYQNEATDGIVDVLFTNANANQTINCNSTTFFYRIVINKGTDDTYELSLKSTSVGNFRLLGFANDDNNADLQTEVQNRNAFALINGTAEIGSNVEIPVLNRNGNCAISSTTRLWVNGGDVRKTSASAIVPYGKVQISAGYLQATGNSGLTIRENGLIIVEGGSVLTNQIRTSIEGIGSLGGYQQLGGSVIVDGTSGTDNDYYIFSLTYTGNVFLMSGGTLTVRNINNKGAIFINSDPGNINVTGGSLIVESGNTKFAKITSRAPFYNMYMRASKASVGNVTLDGGTSGSSGSAATLAAQPLVVLNDLTLYGDNGTYFPVTFSAVTSDTNVNDVYIGGSLRIEQGAQYVSCFPDFTDGSQNNYNGANKQPTHVNTTYFNQTVATSPIDSIYWENWQYFDYDGEDGPDNNENMLELGNFVLDRDSGNELRLTAPGPDGSLRDNNQLTVDVNGDAEVRSGTFDQGRLSFRIWGNIVNNDRFGTYYASGSYPTSSGTPNAAQIRFREDPPISITTTDGAIFGNVRFKVNSNTPVELTSDVIIERMQYQRGYIYLKNYNLRVDELWDLDDNQKPGYFEDNASSSLIDIQPVSYFSGSGNNASRAGDILVYTDGKASDGGLSLKITENTLSENEDRRRDNRGPVTFPVGFTLDGGVNIYNRPAQVKVKDFVSEGYITIRPVSGELQTTNLAGGELLEQYWRVTHDFVSGDEPTVAMRFYYYNQDGIADVDLQSGATNEASYVPGYVLDNSPFTRIYESDADAENSTTDGPDDVTDVDESSSATRRTITFNGSDTNGEFDQSDFTGFTIVNANYTTGVSTRFVGTPEIYYSRQDGDWHTHSTWSTDAVAKHEGSAASDYPKIGDIAIIAGSISDDSHAVTISEEGSAPNDIQVASLIFDGDNSPQLTIQTNGNLNSVDLGVIEGKTGTNSHIIREIAPSTYTLNGDFGQWSSLITNDFEYKVHDNNTPIPTNISEFPNLIIAGNQSGNKGSAGSYYNATLTHSINILGAFSMRSRVRLFLENGATESIMAQDTLLLGNSNPGVLVFPETGQWTVTVGGINLLGGSLSGYGRDAGIIIDEDATVDHKLVVKGDIRVEEKASGNGQPKIDLYANTGGGGVILELQGESNAGTDIMSGDGSILIPDLYRLIMNKGSDPTYSFTLNHDFTLPDINVTNSQPIEILNGLLVFNNSAIDVKLTDETRGNFFLPNTANLEASSGSGGLEIKQGVARIEGNDTGIILDGLLKVSGGTLDMDDASNNGNNFIEYSSSGQASIEVSSGTLTVGSQIRRGLNANTGILQYTQSGGTVIVGKNAAPEASRGIFEIINGDSYVEHTGGSLTLVRDNNSPTVASLLLEPAYSNIADGTVISIGNGSTPANQDRFGIQSNIDLAELEIASANINTKLYSLPLTANILDVGTGTEFNANGFNLTIRENLNNDGTFITSGNSTNNQTTDFPISSGDAATITGSGTTNFWNFEKSGTGTLSLFKDVTVNNNTFIYAGTLNTQSSRFNVKKDVLHDGIHTSDAAGPGIIFNGSQKQILDRSGPGTSELGVINVNNASGLLIRDTEENFVINEKLTLTTGVFDVGGNLIEFPEDAFIENGSGGTGVNDFNVNNMIQTNSAIRDFGIRKHFNALSSGSETFTYPVGLVAYTPVVLNITDISNGFITVRPVRDIPPIAEDSENDGTICTDGVEIVDSDNVLQYHWIIRSGGVTGLKGDFKMYYSQADVEATSGYTEVNYGAARLYDSDTFWDKNNGTGSVEESANIINFDFDGNDDSTLEGIYTAGVIQDGSGGPLCGAIPDQVPQYVTFASGSNTFYNNNSYDGSNAPPLSTSVDVSVKSGFTLQLDANNVRTRKITIESGGTLEIQSGVINTNLGFVEGEGTIKLVVNDPDSPTFPAGDFSKFFPDENCTGGGGLEYAGAGSYAVLADLPNIRRVIFSGNGTRTLPNGFALNVCEDFDIRDNVVVEVGSSNTTVVRGNVYKSDNSDFDNGGVNSKIVMAGASAQAIRGDFTGLDAFNELEIDNAAGVTIVNGADAVRGISTNQDVVVNNTLQLTSGILTTNSNNTLTINNSGTYTGGSASSYVNGPLTKNNVSASTTFTFPIGRNGRYSPASVINASVGNQNWTAEYFTTNQRDRAAFDPGSGAETLTSISNDMWRITSSGNNAANVRVNWNASSGVGDVNDTRVVYWDNKNNPPYTTADNDGIDNRWENKGGTSFSGNSSIGSVTSQGQIPFTSTDVSFGTANVVLPVELISFSVQMEDKAAMLHWATASEKNNDFFEIQRSVNAQDWTVLGTLKGAGDSYQELSYNFSDKSPIYGISYYRLRQVDFDGQFEYSNIIVLENFADDVLLPNPEVLLYPNPARLDELVIRGLHLQPYQEVQVSLTDVYGKQLSYVQVQAEVLEKGMKIDRSIDLASGLYIVTVKQGNILIQKKLILKK